MATRISEVAGGVVDGVNVTFGTSVDYRPGTLIAMINGIACSPVDLTELTAGTFALSAAPKATSLVTVRYTAVT